MKQLKFVKHRNICLKLERRHNETNNYLKQKKQKVSGRDI